MNKETIVCLGRYKLFSIRDLYTSMIVLLPILNGYRVFGMNFMDFFNVTALLLFILFHSEIDNSNNLYKSFIPYFIYTCLTIVVFGSTLSTVRSTLIVKDLISYLSLVFNFYVIAIQLVDVIKAYRIFTRIVLLLSIIVFIETLVYLLFSYRMELIIPFAKLNYNNGSLGIEYINALKSYPGSYRASALFMEPSHLAEYLLVWLFISLSRYNSDESKYIYIYGGIVSLAICLTTSSLGMIGCAVVWTAYILRNLLRKGSRNSLLIIPFLAVGVYFTLGYEEIQNQIAKQLYSLQDITRYTSLSVRLFRGWYCFANLDTINKIFGCGYSLIFQFFTEHNIRAILDTSFTNITVMNGLSLMVCSVGIIGTILYLLPFIRKCVKTTDIFMLFICWTLIMLTAQGYDTATVLLLTVFILILSSSPIGLLKSIKEKIE